MSDAQEILHEYERRKQLNSQLGLQEQYDYLKQWAAQTSAEKCIIKQAFENFKLLGYREWFQSFQKIDCFDTAPWRVGLE